MSLLVSGSKSVDISRWSCFFSLTAWKPSMSRYDIVSLRYLWFTPLLPIYLAHYCLKLKHSILFWKPLPDVLCYASYLDPGLETSPARLHSSSLQSLTDRDRERKEEEEEGGENTNYYSQPCWIFFMNHRLDSHRTHRSDRANDKISSSRPLLSTGPNVTTPTEKGVFFL